MTSRVERADPKPQPLPRPTDSALEQAPARGEEERASGRGQDAGADAALLRAPSPVGGSWVTCYGRYRPTSTPERDVTRLGLLCGPENGMKLVGATISGETSENPSEHALDARPGECFRIFAVGESAMADLAVEVRDPKGVPVASDHNADRWPVLNPDGPFCLLDGGRYSVRVHPRQGKGRFALQIWRLP